MTPLSPVHKAIKFCGGQVALAEALGISQAAVSQWLRGGRPSLPHAIQIVRLTGGEVSIADLRPDMADLVQGSACPSGDPS